MLHFCIILPEHKKDSIFISHVFLVMQVYIKQLYVIRIVLGHVQLLAMVMYEIFLAIFGIYSGHININLTVDRSSMGDSMWANVS